MTDIQTSLLLLIVRPSILNPVMHFSTQTLTDEMKWPKKYTFTLHIPFHLLRCRCNICHEGGNGSKMLQSSHMWWWRSSLHMRHDIESCDQGGEDQDKTWLDGSVASVKGKSEALERWTTWWWSFSKTWCRWTKAMVKRKWSQDRWTNMITWWYEVDHIIIDHVGACVALTLEKMEWNAQGKGIT